jgi:hypothetical protein
MYAPKTLQDGSGSIQILPLPLVLVQGLNATLGIVECFTGYLELCQCVILHVYNLHVTLSFVCGTLPASPTRYHIQN